MMMILGASQGRNRPSPYTTAALPNKYQDGYCYIPMAAMFGYTQLDVKGIDQQAEPSSMFSAPSAYTIDVL